MSVSLDPQPRTMPLDAGPAATGAFVLARVDPAAVSAEVIRKVMALPEAPPPAPGALPASVARWVGIGLAAVAGRYLTSEGELNLAKDLGQMPRYVGLRQVQDAGRAMHEIGWSGAGMGEAFSPDQKGRFIVGAAELMAKREAGQLDTTGLERAMTDLLQVVGQRATPGPAAGPQLPPGLRQPAPQASAPPAATVPPPAPTRIEPGEPSRIGGATAIRVPFSEEARSFVQAQARAFNADSTTDVALGYAVRDQRDGNWYVERIGPISPGEARSLMWNLDQAGRLSGSRDANYYANGIGYRTPEGGTVTPDQNLKDREAEIYFGKLEPEHLLGAAQANALTVNGMRGRVVGAGDYAARAADAASVNHPERGTVSLVVPRQYDIPGPHGRTMTVTGAEVFPDITPAQARAVINGAAGYVDRNRDGRHTPDEFDPKRASLARPPLQVLADNGLSEAELDQAEETLRRRAAPPAATVIKPQPVPAPIPQTVPGPIPQTVPAPIPQTVPGPIPQTVPGPIPQTVPGPIPQPVPEVEQAGRMSRETAEAIAGERASAPETEPQTQAGGVGGGRQGPPVAPPAAGEPGRADEIPDRGGVDASAPVPARPAPTGADTRQPPVDPSAPGQTLVLPDGRTWTSTINLAWFGAQTRTDAYRTEPPDQLYLRGLPQDGSVRHGDLIVAQRAMTGTQGSSVFRQLLVDPESFPVGPRPEVDEKRLVHLLREATHDQHPGLGAPNNEAERGTHALGTFYFGAGGDIRDTDGLLAHMARSADPLLAGDVRAFEALVRDARAGVPLTIAEDGRIESPMSLAALQAGGHLHIESNRTFYLDRYREAAAAATGSPEQDRSLGAIRERMMAETGALLSPERVRADHTILGAFLTAPSGPGRQSYEDAARALTDPSLGTPVERLSRFSEFLRETPVLTRDQMRDAAEAFGRRTSERDFGTAYDRTLAPVLESYRAGMEAALPEGGPR